MKIRNYSFDWGQRTYLMGVLNVTPDSFSDGGQFNTIASALSQAQYMVQVGADIIDVGGQSTRPGAETIALQEELDRVIPIIEAIRSQLDIPISVDTTRSLVAKEAIAVGADIINDISGATFDEAMLDTVAELDVPIILMHLRGTPQTMQQLTDYKDVVAEIYEFLASRIEKAITAGIERTNIIIDPGIGFAKTGEQNLEILRNLPSFKKLGVPLLVGVSRKSFLGQILNQPDPGKRVWGTGAACSVAIAGGTDILRVHDVAEMYDVSRVTDAISRKNP